MEKIKRHKVYLTWLLLAMFTLPFSAKTVHTYHNIAEYMQHDCSDTPHSHHDCSNCPVCHFTLSSFTETTIAEYDFRVISSGFKPAISFQNKSYQQVFFSYGLRAPPVT